MKERVVKRALPDGMALPVKEVVLRGGGYATSYSHAMLVSNELDLSGGTIVQLYRPRQNAVHSLERSFFSLGYIALPVSLLNCIVSLSAPRLLLGVFMFIWLYDTGAYCVGMLVGRHRLFERISPKKSWEGVLGGVLACGAGAYVTHTWFDEFFQSPGMEVWLGLSVAVAVFATFGDLVESLIKRTVGVKDSGSILPGHGGILDRIDSLLLVAPAVLIYLLLVVPNITQ